METYFKNIRHGLQFANGSLQRLQKKGITIVLKLNDKKWDRHWRIMFSHFPNKTVPFV